MKIKIYLLFVMVFLINFVSAADIAYVLENPLDFDPEFIAAINELGYTYELVDDSVVSLTDFSNYKMILLGRENIDDVPVNDFPSLILDPSYSEGWARDSGKKQRDQLPLQANNSNYNHPITGDVLDIFDVYTQARYNGLSIPMYYLYWPETDVVPITNVLDEVNEFVVAVKYNPNRVWFGITESAYWTEESKTLFKNSISWVIGGGPGHNCGNGIKESGEECDDGNTDNGDGCSSSCKVESSNPGNEDFSDVNLCEIGEITPELEISIKEPDDGDDFEVGEIIEGEIEIDNDSDEDMDVELEIYLYDLDEDEVVEDIDDEIDVKDGKSEDFEFELKIDSDVDADNDFVLLVLAEADEDEEYCNFEYVEIDIERAEHMVVIDEIDIKNDGVSAGSYLDVEVEVKNVGENDEDVYVEIEIEELNVSKKSEEFELEEYDEDDSETKMLSIKIPEDAKEKNYELKATVVYDDGDDSETESFSVSGKKRSKTSSVVDKDVPAPIIADPISLGGGSINLGTTTKSSGTEFQSDLSLDVKLVEEERKSEVKESSLQFRNIDIILVIGILILLIAIAVVLRR